MYGGYIEYWFTKTEYDSINSKSVLGYNIMEQVEKLTTQFPEYEMIRVIIQTRTGKDDI